MEPTQRFADLVGGPPAGVALDEAALLIAAHAHPGLDVDAELARIDDLAAGCPAPTLDALVDHLFVELGFRGNRCAYYDPRNSYLNDVIDRRLGIPITLSVLTLAVGRRIGVPLAPVSMPGHFLLRDRVDPATFVDPFAGGALLDEAGCATRFRAIQGDEAPFDPSYLQPVEAPTVLSRMLANLRSIFQAGHDRAALTWVLRLRTLLPDAGAEDRADLAAVLAATGHLTEAARQYDDLAGQVGGELGAGYAASAHRLRARLN
ncbi:MAG: transglutaminase-like domain-containing protein [Acidimicrobiales bacterium]